MSDFRLVPAAVVAWALAWGAVALPARVAFGGVAIGVAVVGAGTCWCVVRRPRRTPGALRADGGGESTHVVPAASKVPTAALGVVLVAAVGAGVLLSAGADRAGSAPLRALASDHAAVALRGQVASAVVPVRNHFTGTVDQYRVTLTGQQVRGRGVTQAAAGQVVVTGDSRWANVRYGGVVEVDGRLAQRGLDLVLQATSGPVEIRGPAAFLRVIESMRAGLLDASEGLSGQARGLVPGLAIGDTSRLEDGLSDDLKTTSLTHITAVSGGHFVIIVAVMVALCGWLRVPAPVRIFAMAMTMAGFVVLVHPQPSVLRAAAMGGVGLVALALRRPARGLPALAASVVVLLIIDPGLAREYGFVLSVAATAGLVLVARPMAARLAPWTGRTAAHAMAIPFAAQLACGPILVLLDPGIGLYAVPANLLAAPALGPATVLGVAAALISPWWAGGAHVLAWVAGLFTWWIAAVAQWFAGLPGARIPWLSGVGGAVLLAAITVAVPLAIRYAWPGLASPESGIVAGQPQLLRALRVVVTSVKGRRAMAAVGIVSAVVAAWLVGSVWTRRDVAPDWAVAACDVGQGDALVVRTGRRSAIVIDTGPEGEAAAGCLRGLGVEHIDLLVLTHFHADHVGGTTAVLHSVTVEAALVTGLAEPAEQADRTLQALAAKGVPVEVAHSGDTGTVGGGEAGGEVGAVGKVALWTVLQAAPTTSAGIIGAAGALTASAADSDGSVANEASIALLIEVDGLRVVSLGDLEEAGQDRLAGAVGDGLEPVDVVKMAHHGSASQSERLAEVLRPVVAVVGVGENTYGHPTKTAISLYEGLGATVLRTDECGTFAISNHPDGLSVQGCH